MGFKSAEIKDGKNGNWYVGVCFDTREEAAAFQGVAYTIGFYMNGKKVDEDKDPFYDGIAKNVNEAGFESQDQPTEKQISFAKRIATKIRVPLPKEKTRKAFSDYIKANKPKFDRMTLHTTNGVVHV